MEGVLLLMMNNTMVVLPEIPCSIPKLFEKGDKPAAGSISAGEIHIMLFELMSPQSREETPFLSADIILQLA